MTLVTSFLYINLTEDPVGKILDFRLIPGSSYTKALGFPNQSNSKVFGSHDIYNPKVTSYLRVGSETQKSTVLPTGVLT